MFMFPEWLTYEWFLPETLKSFKWANSYFLFGLLLIPLLILIQWFFGEGKKQKLQLTLDEKTGSVWYAWLRFLPSFFFLSAISMAILALARPQRELSLDEEFSEGLNIVLALDISESMLTTDILPNRLESAKGVAKQFISSRKNDKMGLVIFSGEAFTLCPLTSDYPLLTDYLNNVSASLIKASGTAIGNAIATAINRLRDSPGEGKVIILLSDGDNTAGTLGPETATELAKSFNIRIYSIALGSRSARELDLKTLQNVALESGGSFFEANSGESLISIFSEIDQLEKIKMENRKNRERTDYYFIYLNWAICFILISFLFKITIVGNYLVD